MRMETGKGKCPFEPSQHYTAVMAGGGCTEDPFRCLIAALYLRALRCNPSRRHPLHGRHQQLPGNALRHLQGNGARTGTHPHRAIHQLAEW